VIWTTRTCSSTVSSSRAVSVAATELAVFAVDRRPFGRPKLTRLVHVRPGDTTPETRRGRDRCVRRNRLPVHRARGGRGSSGGLAGRSTSSAAVLPRHARSSEQPVDRRRSVHRAVRGHGGSDGCVGPASDGPKRVVSRAAGAMASRGGNPCRTCKAHRPHHVYALAALPKRHLQPLCWSTVTVSLPSSPLAAR
jgi:hypothetical protein